MKTEMKFVASILSPDVTNFENFIKTNFPEVELALEKFSFGSHFTFTNVSLDDGKSMWHLWIDSYNN